MKTSVATVFGLMFLLLTSCVPVPSIRCLVSPMSGELKIEGRPAAKVKIVRYYRNEWYNKEKTESTYTDTLGRFEFSGVWRAAPVALVHQPVTHIEVMAEYDGQIIRLLWASKMDYSRFGELEGAKSGIAKLSRKDDKLNLYADIIKSNKEYNQWPEPMRMDDCPAT